MHLFVSPHYGQMVRHAPGPVPVVRDTTLDAVWLCFNYTGCVKESRWKKGQEVLCAWRNGGPGSAVGFRGGAPTSQKRDVGHPAMEKVVGQPRKQEDLQASGLERSTDPIERIRPSYAGQGHFWARGYFVSTVGRDEATIREYI